MVVTTRRRTRNTASLFRIRRSLLPIPAILASACLAASCGGGSSGTSASADLPVRQDDASFANAELRTLDVNFSLPERLNLLGTALTATVTAGGSEAAMESIGGSYSGNLQLLKEQQLQVYVGIRRAEDGLLLAAADVSAWIGSTDTRISVPEQRFSYGFDQDGDGVDNIVEIERGTSPNTISQDFDADGLPDDLDEDDDNDGVGDLFDAFPFNGQEFEDTDGDGIGNNADFDDDGDGVLDESDAFPRDGSEVLDSDFDGIGDNADTDADGNGIDDDQEDSDGDGVPDPIDLYPDDRYESQDSDGDGIGDNADTDDNGDGIEDSREGSQIIVPYVDDAEIAIDGRWDSGYRNGNYYDEWGKAADNDSYGRYLGLNNLLVNNTNTSQGQYGYYSDASFELLHDGEYLYIKINVYGEELENWFNDSDDVWQDDSAEVYLDVGYDRFDAYGDNDYQRLFRFRDTASDPTLDGFYSASGMESSHATSYRHENSAESVYSHLYEIRISLDAIGLAPGDTFGFDVAINDDDDGGDRETKWAWWSPVGSDQAWQRPSVFGKAKLQPSD